MYELRKAVNRFNRPNENRAEWSEYGLFADGESQAATAAELRPGGKAEPGRLGSPFVSSPAAEP